MDINTYNRFIEELHSYSPELNKLTNANRYKGLEIDVIDFPKRLHIEIY